MYINDSYIKLKKEILHVTDLKNSIFYKDINLNYCKTRKSFICFKI